MCVVKKLKVIIRERAGANGIDTGESNGPWVAFTRKAAHAVIIDTEIEESTQSWGESEEEMPYTNKWGGIGSHDDSEMQQPANASNRLLYLGHSEYYLTFWELKVILKTWSQSTSTDTSVTNYDGSLFLRDLEVPTVAIAGHLV